MVSTCSQKNDRCSDEGMWYDSVEWSLSGETIGPMKTKEMLGNCF